MLLLVRPQMAPKTISRRPLFSGNLSAASHVPGTGMQNYHFRRHLQYALPSPHHRLLQRLLRKNFNRRQTKPNHSFNDRGRRYAQARTEVPRSTLRRTCARVRGHTPSSFLYFKAVCLEESLFFSCLFSLKKQDSRPFLR